MTTTNDISLARVMDTMAEGVFVLDATCSISLWNRAMTEMTGWHADAMIGKSCADLICSVNAEADANGTKPALDCALLNHADGKLAVSQVECKVRTSTNKTVPVLKNARVLLDDNEKPTGVVVTLTDLRPLRQLEEDLAVMRHEAIPVRGLGRLVGGSTPMQNVYARIAPAGDSEVTVLIEGETGTGKELAAEAIHAMSARKDKPLVKVNCSALSENLLESELFGHVKGAFTGAVKDKVGRIEMAEGGTLFLDEIGDVSPLIQLKLLRVLQEHEYERVGESTPRKANVRFIAATHRDLKQRVNEGNFREDFYYRIRVFSVPMPALREHKEDIPLLCNAFIRKLKASTAKQITALAPEVVQGFMDYCWPGNVRELENAIEHAFVTCNTDTIALDDIPFEIRSASQRAIECQDRRGDRAASLRATSTPPLTRERLQKTLHACNGNQSETARHLNIDRTTVWRKMKQWDIETPQKNVS